MECLLLSVYISRSTCTRSNKWISWQSFPFTDGTLQKTGPTSLSFAYQVPAALGDNVELQNTVNYFWTRSVSLRTNRVYSTGFQTYCRFFTMNAITWLSNQFPPISEDILIYFVAHCVHVLHLQFSTIQIYLCGIRYIFVVHTGVNPLVTEQGHPLPRLTD